MKQFMKLSLALLCSALFVPSMHGVTSVAVNTGGGASSGTTFQTAVLAADFYKPTQTMFFGLTQGASTNAVGYTPSGWTQATGLNLTYTGIAWTGATDVAANTGLNSTSVAYDASADNAQIQSSNITALAVVGDPTSDTTRTTLDNVRIVFLSSGAAASSALPVGVHVMTTTRGIPVYKPLTDADSTTATVNTMTLVAGVAGSKMCAFAAVKDKDTSAANKSKFGADAGGDGIIAMNIDSTTNAISIPSTGGKTTLDLTLSNSLAFGAVGTTAVEGPAMCYDEVLKRLYVGVQYTTASSGAHAGGFSVAIFDVNASDGALTPLLQAGTSAANPNPIPVVAGDRNIIAAKGTSAALAPLKLAVMHTSTGPDPDAATKYSYLIVNGGNGAKAAVANQVWAIPLVVGSSEAVTTVGTGDTDVINGTFANVNTANFSTRAAASGDLYTTTTNAAKVGNGPLPCPANTDPADIKMWVDGDAVYCSISADASSTVTPGIFHSQCIFNQHGQIDHWTEWQRVSPNELGGPVATNKGKVSFFAVDANSTQILAVDDAKTALRATTWQKDSLTGATTPVQKTTGLLYTLNQSTNFGGEKNGCTAVCDLNSSSTAWGATTPMRMTLFGGLKGQVCFAITGSATTAAASLATTNTGLLNYVDFDYSLSGTFKKTTVGSNNNPINSLAFSGWNPLSASETPGFFLAGAEEDGGLYAWALPSLGAGFNATNVLDFNADPFRTDTGPTANRRSWQKLTNFDGHPGKIVARGGAVYVISHGDETKKDRIYRMTRKNTATLLNSDLRVIATAGKTPTAGSTNSDLGSVNRIYDLVVTITAPNDSTAASEAGEQLMMLTDDGIYTTTCSIGTSDSQVGKVDNDTNPQLICGWVKMTSPDSTSTWQDSFGEPAYTRNPQTFWFGRNEQHEDKSGVYSRETFKQISHKNLLENGPASTLNSGAVSGNWQLNPTNFNAYDQTAVEPTAFGQLEYHNTGYFDGSRRLFEFYSIDEKKFGLFALPWNTGKNHWNRAGREEFFVASPHIETNDYIYWISNIGSTGKLLAGAKTGVIGLA